MDTSDQLEGYRVTHGTFATPEGAAHGAFVIPVSAIRQAGVTEADERIIVLVDDGRNEEEPTGWEHVSAHVKDRHGNARCPFWEEMDALKDLFWEPDETVIQYHPPDGEKINVHSAVLHLWRPIDVDVPLPPADLVGPQPLSDLQTEPG